MIKTTCDLCGKVLDKKCSDQVNLDFNAYGCTGFSGPEEMQFCVPCADKVVEAIDALIGARSPQGAGEGDHE